MVRILIVILLALSLGCASIPVSEKFAIGCTSGDIATTAYGLANGFEEANPLIQQSTDASTLIVAAGTSVIAHYILRKVDKKAAWWAYGSVRCAAGTWNLRKIMED